MFERHVEIVMIMGEKCHFNYVFVVVHTCIQHCVFILPDLCF